MNGDRTILALSSDAAALIRILRKMEVGQVLTYEDLSNEIGRDVRQNRGALRTARVRVLKDDAVHTAVVAKVGVKRLSSSEAGRALEYDLRRTRSAARRGRLRASRLNVGEIPQDERASVFARSSLLELIDYAGSPKAAMKAIAAAASAEDRALPLRRMLAALKE